MRTYKSYDIMHSFETTDELQQIQIHVT